MLDTKTLKTHAALVDDMARAQGIDLEEQILRGRLDITNLDDMVLRCTGCASAQSCRAWLDGTEDGTASATPLFCRNAEVFAEL